MPLTPAAPTLPALTLPAIARSALLLDLDGTLLDLAPTPEAVTVPPGLIDALLALRPLLGDALAIISGRPVDQIDALLPGVPFAVAGEHGGALRRAPGAALTRPDLPSIPDGWVNAASRIVASSPGARLEEKLRGFVVHYRAIPHAGLALRVALDGLVTDARFEIMAASMAWEVRPRGIDKGTAVSQLMQEPPFKGRLPLFIGDDVTDHDAIRTADAMGGVGLLVETAFGTPAAVRAWIAAAGSESRWPGLR